MIAIKAKSDSNELVGELRELLPELGIAEIKKRLSSGAVLAEREPFQNDSDEVHGLLRSLVALLKRRGADYAIHEWVADSGVFDGPDPRNRIDDQVLENILRGFEDGVKRQREQMDREIGEKGYAEVEPEK